MNSALYWSPCNQDDVYHPANTIAIGHEVQTISLYNLTFGTPVASISVGFCVNAVSLRGDLIVGGGGWSGGEIKVYSLDRAIEHAKSHEGRGSSPASRDAAETGCLFAFTEPRRPVRHLAIDSDNRLIVSYRYGMIRVFDLNGAVHCTSTLQQEYSMTGLVALHGPCVYVATRDHKVKVYDLVSGRFVRMLAAHHDEIVQFAVYTAADGRGPFMLSAAKDHTVRMYDLRAGTGGSPGDINPTAGHGALLREYVCARQPTAMFFDGDARLATAHDDGSVAVWDFAQRKAALPAHTLKAHNGPLLYLGGDQARLVCGAQGGRVDIFDFGEPW